MLSILTVVVRDKTGLRCLMLSSPWWWLTYAAGRFRSIFLKDIVLTRGEIEGLASGLWYKSAYFVPRGCRQIPPLHDDFLDLWQRASYSRHRQGVSASVWIHTSNLTKFPCCFHSTPSLGRLHHWTSLSSDVDG